MPYRSRRLYTKLAAILQGTIGFVDAYGAVARFESRDVRGFQVCLAHCLNRKYAQQLAERSWRMKMMPHRSNLPAESIRRKGEEHLVLPRIRLVR